jgi:single-stranded DNA-binding protein
MNLAVLIGTLSSAPDRRDLASGDVLVQLQITTRVDATARSVPVAVLNPPAWVEALGPGEAVVVLGFAHRRFFRTVNGTSSRTEIVAERVARATDSRARTRLFDRAAAIVEHARESRAA